MNLSRVWRGAAQPCVDFLFPPLCAACGCDLTGERNADRASGRLCLECAASLSGDAGPQCARCAAPIGPHLDASGPCAFCRQEGYAFERAWSIGAYDGDLREAVLGAKAPGGEALTVALAELLWRRSGPDLATAGAVLVVPAPHHWTDRLPRGHIAAETLARAMARLLRIPCDPHILQKVRRTPKQTQLTPAQRRTNLRNAFRPVRSANLQSQTVLLVDDVLTTGATAHTAAAELKKAGAGRVVVAVAARGLGGSRVRTT